MEDLSCNFIFLEVQAPHNLGLPVRLPTRFACWKILFTVLTSTIVGEYSRPQNEDDLNVLTSCNAAPTVKSKMATRGPQKVLEWGLP